MNKDPFVSVYMTVRNGLPFVKEAIVSVQGQTYKDWELVIVDDGSSDGTLTYLNEAAAQDLRVKVIATGGVGRARALNIALRNCRGQYLSNLDADDLYHPERLRLCVLSVANSVGAEFVYTDTVIFSDRSPFATSGVPCDQSEGAGVRDVTKLMLTKSLINHSAVFICRSVFDRVGLYDEGRNAQLDYDLWYRIAEAGIRVYKLDVRLSGKRVHDAQSFESRNRFRYVCSSYKLKKRYLNNIGASYLYHAMAVVFLCYSLLPVALRYRLRLSFDWVRGRLG